jgi:hypothetical protein
VIGAGDGADRADLRVGQAAVTGVLPLRAAEDDGVEVAGRLVADDAVDQPVEVVAGLDDGVVEQHLLAGAGERARRGELTGHVAEVQVEGGGVERGDRR